jgi:DNA polymerase (family 10)
MNNSDIADILKAYADLSELHGGNPFKIKSFAAASFRIDKLPIPLANKSITELEAIDGVGKSIAKVVYEIAQNNRFPDLEELIANTPEGVRDIMRIKGIGPKKVAVIWKEMQIETIGELLYACKENRLAQFKGFGLKTQEAVIKQIEFMFASANKFHFAKAQPIATSLFGFIQQCETYESASLCGHIRRGFEVLESIDILIATDNEEAFKQELSNLLNIAIPANQFTYLGYPIHVYFSTPDAFAWELFRLSSDTQHAEKILARIGSPIPEVRDEEEIYEVADLPFIKPVLRDNRNEIELAAQGKLPELIEYGDLKGPLHNHSTWSDGLNTISEMAAWCNKQGFEYLGMADHSKSAFYAKGLNEERVLAQQEEIKKLNLTFKDFRIFAGIECDILYDGNLDYDNSILKTFDYVVASVHSILKMTEEKAMERLLKAIENPYTTILGHPTGRLLLMREGYPINHHKIIDACAANNVVIELNANPYRLDMDWRYIDYALEKGVMISINPDAHELEGFLDMHWGIVAAQKGGLYKEMCFNAKSALELDTWFKKKRG